MGITQQIRKILKKSSDEYLAFDCMGEEKYPLNTVHNSTD